VWFLVAFPLTYSCEQSLENAHTKNTIISSLTFSLDNRTLLTRGNDNTLKSRHFVYAEMFLKPRAPVWDIRQFKKPLHVRDDLPNRNQETNVIFSPDENLILTGTAGRAAVVGDKAKPIDAAESDGKLVILRRSDLSTVRSLDLSAGNVVKVLWQPKINQIFASTSLGAVHVLYSPETSIKGATLSLSRVARRKQTEEAIPTFDQIYVPDNMPMFKDPDMETRLKGKQVRKKRDADGDVKGATNQPATLMGQGTGGRVGASATQHLVQGMKFNRTRDEDPREALLKFADKADKDKLWTKIYDTSTLRRLTGIGG
jgi:hypothetical protein